MNVPFRYKRGDLITDIGRGSLPYRIARLLRDDDTGVGLYVIKHVDSNTELLCNGKGSYAKYATEHAHAAASRIETGRGGNVAALARFHHVQK